MSPMSQCPQCKNGTGSHTISLFFKTETFAPAPGAGRRTAAVCNASAKRRVAAELCGSGFLERGPLDATLQPGRGLRPPLQIDPCQWRPCKDGGHVQIGRRERVAEQVGASAQRTVEDRQRCGKLRFGA